MEIILKYIEISAIGRKRKQTPMLPKSTLQIQTRDHFDIWKVNLLDNESFIKRSRYF